MRSVAGPKPENLNSFVDAFVLPARLWDHGHVIRAAACGAFALALMLGVLGSASAGAAEEKCAGHRVTISWTDPGVGEKIDGSGRPDVIQGGPGNESIRSYGGEDVVCGGGGQDDIQGGDDRDILLGQAGDDEFFDLKSPLAADFVVGGGGRDTAAYNTAAGNLVAVRVNQKTGLVHGEGAPRVGAIHGIEVVEGTLEDDELIGDEHAQHIKGLAGNDHIDGGGGGDRLEGNHDIDTLSYRSAKAPVQVNLMHDFATVGTGRKAETDHVDGFEVLVGTHFDDKLAGTDDKDLIIGGAGDDKMFGIGGEDTLEGEAGDDSIYPGSGDDTVDGGSNEPVKGLRKRGDAVSYANDHLTDEDARQFEAYLAVDRFGNPPDAHGVGHDLFARIESVRGVKGATNILQGNDRPNVLIGGNRTDALIGGGGNDFLYGLDNASDSLAGDAGDDFLDGGDPNGEGDADHLDGGDGTDTCIHAGPLFIANCEKGGS